MAGARAAVGVQRPGSHDRTSAIAMAICTRMRLPGVVVECLESETTAEKAEARVLTCPHVELARGRCCPGLTNANQDGVESLMTNPRLCYVDSLGTDWRIYEVASANVPAPRGSNCLIFESTQAVRRVWNYPPNWHKLSSDELSALSWNT